MKEREFVDKCFSKKLHGVPDTKSSRTKMVDDITSLITLPGLINLTRKDIKQVADKGKYFLGLSVEGKGKDRATKVGKKLISLLPNKLKNNNSTSVIFNITGSPDLTLYEVNDIAEYIYNAANADADIIFGAVIDENKKDYVKATAVFGSN
jgi:cell division protein FtsZ